jgi:hypothetical protein
MDYPSIYKNLINKRLLLPASQEGYSEKHHIIPRSLGGADIKNNIVHLTAREHFIAHLLLCKIHQNDIASYAKMLKAFLMMLTCQSGYQNRYISSRKYQYLREQMAQYLSVSYMGEANSQFGTKWIHRIETGEAKKIKCSEELPIGWDLGRVQKYKQYKKSFSKSTKEYTRRRRQSINKLRIQIFYKVKYCRYFLEFANGSYNSIIKFTTSKGISKTNEPLNRSWRLLFPKIDKYKNSTKGFSSLQARQFLNDFNIKTLKQLFHFIMAEQHEGRATGLHPEG